MGIFNIGEAEFVTVAAAGNNFRSTIECLFWISKRNDQFLQGAEAASSGATFVGRGGGFDAPLDVAFFALIAHVPNVSREGSVSSVVR